MADKHFNHIKILLKTLSTDGWKDNKNYIPMAGEVCIESMGGLTARLKVGDGTNTWATLKYIEANAYDVAAWAKAASLPYSALDDTFKAQLKAQVEEWIKSDPSSYATHDWVKAQGYDTIIDVNDKVAPKADKSYVDAELDKKQPKITSTDKLDYNLISGVPAFALVNESGNKLLVVMDTTTYKLSIKLLDKESKVLSEQEVDLPLEEIIIDGRYESETKTIVLVLKNGREIRIPVGEMISGIATETWVINKLTAEYYNKTYVELNYYTKANIDTQMVDDRHDWKQYVDAETNRAIAAESSCAKIGTVESLIVAEKVQREAADQALLNNINLKADIVDLNTAVDRITAIDGGTVPANGWISKHKNNTEENILHVTEDEKEAWNNATARVPALPSGEAAGTYMLTVEKVGSTLTYSWKPVDFV